MRSFELSLPPLRLHSGTGCLGRLQDELRRLGCKQALVFCGRSLALHPTAMAEVRAALGDAYAGTFEGVRAHSPTDSVMAAAGMLRERKADVVVAVGGGSAIVTARAASIVLAEGRELAELCTRRSADGKLVSPKLLAQKIPQLVIPTTPTTAMPKPGSAVHDATTGERLPLFDPKTRASAIFIEPFLLATAPVSLFRNASLNTLAMAVSGLESERASPTADALLRQALLLVARWLPKLEAQDDSEARMQLTHAAVLCGQGTDLTGGGLVTALGHSLGAKAHVDNGVVNGILLPHTMRFNADIARARHTDILAPLQEAAASRAFGDGVDAVGAIRSLLQACGTPLTLRAIGVERDAFDAIVSHAMHDPSLPNNPRPAAREDMLQVLEAAW
jgi:alcohol dehydrogenase class IV